MEIVTSSISYWKSDHNRSNPLPTSLHTTLNTDIPTVKYSGTVSSIILWGLFSWSGTKKLVSLEGKMDRAKDRAVKWENVFSAPKYFQTGDKVQVSAGLPP